MCRRPARPDHRGPAGLALIGCGRMGRVHLAAAGGVGEVELAAVVDPALEPAAAAALRCPHVELDTALASARVEAVLIAAPTRAHEPLVRAALEHGKHVLCEKPLTLDPSSDAALAELARERGLILQVGFWRRFAEPYLALRELVAGGAIGRVGALRAAQWDASPPPAAFCDPEVSGGLEIDCGIHELDLARWLLAGEVEAVAACSPVTTAELAAVGDVATLHGLARLAGGRIMSIDLTRTAGGRDTIRTEAIGDCGSACVEFEATGALVVRTPGRCERTPLAARDVIAEAVRAQLRAFARATRSGSLDPEAACAADSTRALVAARALREARAARSWMEVALPLHTESVNV